MRCIGMLTLVCAVALVASSASQANADIAFPKAGFEVKMDPEMTVAELRDIVAGKLGVEANDVKLTLDGQELVEGQKLTECNINDASNFDYKLTGAAAQKQPSSTYFGVDADDHDAVKQKQRELSEEKFKELFGEEVHDQLNTIEQEHEHEHEHEHRERQPADQQPGGVKSVLKWLFDIAKRGLGHPKDAPAPVTTEAPQ